MTVALPIRELQIVDSRKVCHLIPGGIGNVAGPDNVSVNSRPAVITGETPHVDAKQESMAVSAGTLLAGVVFIHQNCDVAKRP